jgi:bacillithiol biosynthesis deacetylase BshB1
MDRPLDILAFSPHPDDAELGCGGSLILAADKGLRVAIADLSAGEMSSRGSLELRQREKDEAAKLLGLCERWLVGLPDSEIGTDPAQRLPLIQLIRRTRPRLVLAPHCQDRHPDHAAAGKLVEEACFFAGVRKIGTGEPHRPERLYSYMIHRPFTPSFVVDISAVWTRKMAAVTAYKSQFQTDGSGPETAISRPNFLRLVEARAIYFGAMIGVAYGEPFYLPGPVPLPELPSLIDPAVPPRELPAFSTY